MGELSQCPCGGDPFVEGGGEQFLSLPGPSLAPN